MISLDFCSNNYAFSVFLYITIIYCSIFLDLKQVKMLKKEREEKKDRKGRIHKVLGDYFVVALCTSFFIYSLSKNITQIKCRTIVSTKI